jgi:hypothetical protein
MYTENTRNEENIRTKFHCLYAENMRNESVCILRIQNRTVLQNGTVKKAVHSPKTINVTKPMDWLGVKPSLT